MAEKMEVIPHHMSVRPRPGMILQEDQEGLDRPSPSFPGWRGNSGVGPPWWCDTVDENEELHDSYMGVSFP